MIDDRPMWDDPAESTQLRQLLRAGRSATTEYDLERGLARHLATLQGGAALPEWATKLAVAKGGVSLLWWMIPPLLAVGFIAGAWWSQSATQKPPAFVTTVVSAAQGAREGTVVPSEATLGSGSQQAITHELASARVVRSERGAARSVARAVNARLSSRSSPATRKRPGEETHDVPRTAPDVVAPTTATGPTATGEALPTSTPGAASNAEQTASATALQPPLAAQPLEQQDRREHREADRQADRAEEPPVAPAVQPAAERPTPVPSRSQSQADSRLEREMQMLAVAQRVLPDDPSRALRLARQGEREFSGSMFSAERKQVMLLALVRLGRVDEARRAGRPFLMDYPNAPWSARLRKALVTGKLPAP
jgi:hypothetical protein